MAAVIDRYDRETTGRLELRALEKMIGALCAHIETLADAARCRGRLGSREARLQLEAFLERREKARAALASATSESFDVRLARLEQLVEALDCSRSFFRAAD
jgi:hypothetical protein